MCFPHRLKQTEVGRGPAHVRGLRAGEEAAGRRRAFLPGRRAGHPAAAGGARGASAGAAAVARSCYWPSRRRQEPARGRPSGALCRDWWTRPPRLVLTSVFSPITYKQFLGGVMGGVSGSGAASSGGENGNMGPVDDGGLSPPPRTLLDGLLGPSMPGRGGSSTPPPLPP